MLRIRSRSAVTCVEAKEQIDLTYVEAKEQIDLTYFEAKGQIGCDICSG